MSLAFLENYQMMITNDHPNVSPLGVTWSLCVEEHFYIIWGLLLFFLSPRKLPWLICGSILTAFVCRYLYTAWHLPRTDILTNIDYFAYGALPAFLLVTRPDSFERLLSRLSRPVKYLLLALVVGYVILSPNIVYPYQNRVEPLVFGLLFIITLCCILPEKNAVRIRDRNFLSRLGLYTYGMYLYHTIIINLLVQVYKKMNLPTDVAGNAVSFTLVSFAATVAISMLSYHYFEKYFLRLKSRFARDRSIQAEATSAFAPSGPM
jgi:peptidoglycan/LPS O-acetylase OafA/YrhL